MRHRPAGTHSRPCALCNVTLASLARLLLWKNKQLNWLWQSATTNGCTLCEQGWWLAVTVGVFCDGCSALKSTRTFFKTPPEYFLYFPSGVCELWELCSAVITLKHPGGHMRLNRVSRDVLPHQTTPPPPLAVVLVFPEKFRCALEQ